MFNDIIKKCENKSYEDLKSRLSKIAPTQKNFEKLVELIDFVYYLGVDDGEDIGYKEALKENGMSQDEREEVYQEGYDDGREEAYHEGVSDGREQGYDDGYTDGYDTAHNEVENDAYDRGREEGYDEGYNDASKEFA